MSQAQHIRPGTGPTGGREGAPLVVHVVGHYPPHLGGMEAVVKAIAEGLALHRPVEVLTARSGPAPRVERGKNLIVHRLFALEVAHVPFMPSLLLHLLRLPRQALVHVHIALAYPPEMVWLASKLRRVPFVAHYHLDCDPSGRLGVRWLFLSYKRWILSGVLRSAARVIVLSEEQAEFLQRVHRVARERIVIIPNGVGPEFFREARALPDHGGPFRLLFVGRMSHQKNVARLVRALAQVKEPVELVIVGDGEDRSMLEGLVAQLELSNVRMVGPQRGSDLLDWYQWADAFVLASNKEGMPLVLLEAMASGLPIVATDVPGISDTVGDDGLLAEPDPTALAEAIGRVASDPVLWQELARRSSGRSQRYTWTAVLDAVEEVYGGLLA